MLWLVYNKNKILIDLCESDVTSITIYNLNKLKKKKKKL